MDPRNNPFAPGAGTQPPELAGRDKIIEDADVALARVRRGRPAKSQLLLGLRGVGKTVLLNRIAQLAIDQGYQTIVLEAPEDRRLAEMLVPPLRSALFALSRLEHAREVARRGLGILRAFARAFKVTVGDIEFSVDPEVGTADSGSLEADLPELLMAVARAAKEGDGAVALFIDEVQYLKSADLAALIVSVHRVGQRGLPFVLFGAGLPQLASLAGEAKSYAERLFDYPAVGPLPPADAIAAIRTPVEREGASILDEAVERIARETKGYPYFLQEWGYHSWNAAAHSLITEVDVARASEAALRQLDQGFFRVRFRSPDAAREGLRPGDGFARPRAPPIGRNRRRAPHGGNRGRTAAFGPDPKGHDLQPAARRDRVHGADVRRVHVAFDARLDAAETRVRRKERQAKSVTSGQGLGTSENFDWDTVSSCFEAKTERNPQSGCCPGFRWDVTHLRSVSRGVHETGAGSRQFCDRFSRAGAPPSTRARRRKSFAWSSPSSRPGHAPAFGR
ncbi:MAG TPA: ATP-binding protein [Vulgatibacter sp.]